MLNSIEDIFKFKENYQMFPEYDLLSTKDKRFFDSLFLLLIINPGVNITNEFLSKRFNIPDSTLQKKLKRLEDKHLIYRECHKVLKDNKYWITERMIVLDPIKFAFVNLKIDNGLSNKVKNNLDKDFKELKIDKKKARIINA